MLNSSLLEQAVTFLAGESVAAPPAAQVVEALLQAEKTAKQQKNSYSFGQLIGTWRLGFITGTKKPAREPASSWVPVVTCQNG